MERSQYLMILLVGSILLVKLCGHVFWMSISEVLKYVSLPHTVITTGIFRRSVSYCASEPLQYPDPLWYHCPIPIYAIASAHSLDYICKWDNVSGDLAGNTPVMWVNKAGSYRCTVTHNARNSECFSHVINVFDNGMCAFTKYMYKG